MYRRDRPDDWGGVATSIGPGLDWKLLHKAKDCEALFVEIDLELNGTCKKESLVVGAAYRLPSSSLEYIDCLCNVINPKRAGLFGPISQPGGGGFRPPPLRSRKPINETSSVWY